MGTEEETVDSGIRQPGLGEGLEGLDSGLCLAMGVLVIAKWGQCGLPAGIVREDLNMRSGKVTLPNTWGLCDTYFP